MNMDNNGNRLLHLVVGGIVVFLIVFCLFIDNIYLTWTIVALLGLDALYLTVRYGWQWWREGKGRLMLRERFLAFLASLMFLFLMTGTALFIAAFCCRGGEYINSEYLLRSLSCSFQLFTGTIDSNVIDGINACPYLKGLISLQAFLSFCCTLAVLLNLAYARVYAYYKLHQRTKIGAAHNHLYIFFGMNEPSRLMAKSIRDQEGERAVVIFVESKMQNDESQSGWDNIVEMFTHRRQTFLDVNDLDARLTFTEKHISSLNNGIQEERRDILGEINLIKLRDLIQRLSKNIADAQMHVFFLSENEDENIRALSVIVLDETIQQTHSAINQRFYCHARRNGLNRIIEDIAFKRNIEVRTIDSSYLAVELLKSDESNHPVRLVDIDEKNPTTIKSAFNSLIVGFDEVGRDSLKFLYEFGAFVDSNASPTDEQRSPFHCVVIDKRMEELQGSFANFAPAVMKQRNTGGLPLVELKTCDCQSSMFYNRILSPDFCSLLNYIIIAIGDDELGMTMAIRVLNHIRRIREDLHHLRIYVRSYRSDKEAYLQKIADYYNDGYNNGVKDESFKVDGIIKLFGQSKKIYSYEMVINEELTQKGRKYQESYARLRGETNTTWDSRRKKGQEKGTLDSMRKLRRQELQDLGNALHADTKIYLLKEAMLKTKGTGYDWNDFLNRYFDSNNMPHCDGKYDMIRYPLLSLNENQIILNLARLEHLRWVASHEMLGYTKARTGLHECDERTREHNCLRPWQDLDDESSATLQSEWPCDYKAFDFSVVDNSILLNKDKL